MPSAPHPRHRSHASPPSHTNHEDTSLPNAEASTERATFLPGIGATPARRLSPRSEFFPGKKFQPSCGGRTVARFYLTHETMHAMHTSCPGP